MSFVISRNGIKQLAIQIFGSLPLGLIEWLARSPFNFVRRLAKLGVRNRTVTIPCGVGRGLKFNAGKANPDLALGTYELPIQEILVKHLRPGDTFYDIGANVGFFTAIAAKLVGSRGRVFAFEPVPENATQIEYNARLNRFINITVLETAVTNTTGQGELLLAHHAGGSTLSIADPPPDLRGKLAVELIALDDLVIQQLTPPTVVKIDVEGAEIDVLRGMSRTIEKFKPVIITEVDDGNKETFERKYQELKTLISTFGYQVTTLADAYPNIGWYVGHILAVPDLSNS
jgi:FkbM family methyltransferase